MILFPTESLSRNHILGCWCYWRWWQSGRLLNYKSQNCQMKLKFLIFYPWKISLSSRSGVLMFFNIGLQAKWEFILLSKKCFFWNHSRWNYSSKNCLQSCSDKKLVTLRVLIYFYYYLTLQIFYNSWCNKCIRLLNS